MIVVADSSPLHYLILIGEVHLLQRLYSEVVIPREVLAELTRAGAPSFVSDWLSSHPSWLRVEPASAESIATVTASLDPGERAAIALPETLRADLLLIDEAAGRREANRRQIRVTGIVGVLLAAAENGFVDVPSVLARLKSTSFYIDATFLESVFARWLKP
jgi:predicted nucleic acid-binding protein